MAVGIGTALLGGALVGGGLSAITASKGAKAAERAAGIQAEAATEAGELQAAATEKAIEEQRRQFDVTQELMAPFREAGVSALEQQQALLGLAGAGAQAEAMAGLQDSPAQRFIRERQERALLRNAAAIGGLGGGNVRTALQEQAAGFASQDIQNQFARLGQLAGQGQATSTQLGQFGAGTAQNIANLGVAGGEARASGLLGAQQAAASGILGAQQARAEGLSQFGEAFGTGLMGAALFQR